MLKGSAFKGSHDVDLFVCQNQKQKSTTDFEHKRSKSSLLRIEELLALYGENPISYMITEGDTQYYFSKKCEGVIGYIVKNRVALVIAEPVCADEDLTLFLEEFKLFCIKRKLKICFCQCSNRNRSVFEKAGFKYQEYGQEAIIDLPSYTLEGTQKAKIRWAWNKISKMGYTVHEYQPTLAYRAEIEAQIQAISDEWLGGKKSSELKFMIGSVELDQPGKRRYFYAADPEGSLAAFIVCMPYQNGQGWFVDVTRRSQKAPLGIMEMLVVEAMEILKKEGVVSFSLGLAPLAQITEVEGLQGKAVSSAFQFCYKRLNALYGFKPLYDYKKKYSPSRWESRYILFYPKRISIRLLMAFTEAKNPNGIVDLLYKAVKCNIKKKKV